jgi:hypothetical protein
MDDTTLKKVQNAAKQHHISISRWVCEQLKMKVDPSYPVHFEELYGTYASIKKKILRRENNSWSHLKLSLLIEKEFKRIERLRVENWVERCAHNKRLDLALLLAQCKSRAQRSA